MRLNDQPAASKSPPASPRVAEAGLTRGGSAGTGSTNAGAEGATTGGRSGASNRCTGVAVAAAVGGLASAGGVAATVSTFSNSASIGGASRGALERGMQRQTRSMPSWQGRHTKQNTSVATGSKPGSCSANRESPCRPFNCRILSKLVRKSDEKRAPLPKLRAARRADTRTVMQKLIHLIEQVDDVETKLDLIAARRMERGECT